MIISDAERQQREKERQYGWYLLIGAIGIALLYVVFSLFSPYGRSKDGEIYCDAEHVRGSSFISHSYSFKNGNTQSTEKAFSGNASSKVNRSDPKGMSYTLRKPKQGERYRASVWRYRLGTQGGELVVKGEGNLDLEKRESLHSDKNKNGWELIEITFNVPEFKSGSIQIYVFSNTNSPIYFDDLKIVKIKNAKAADGKKIVAYAPPNLSLEVTDNYATQLKNKREQALREGILSSSDADWVEGKLNDGKEIMDMDLRLKGNWLYHLQGDKWSYKVKVNTPYAWNQMQSFSLVNPAYRSYLQEWLFHVFMKQHGLITTKYDLVNLQFNNKKLGIYAYEEHYGPHLLETNQRKPGVIVKFDDEAKWTNFKILFESLGEVNNGQFQLVNSLNAAKVVPYKPNQTALNGDLVVQMQAAEALMTAYKYNQQPPRAIFNIDALAKYYAAMDVFQAYNSINWSDQKFYYNPTTNKLEPIGAGGYGTEIRRYKKRPFIGYRIFNRNSEESGLHVQLFLDRQFLQKYFAYLYKFSQKKYIKDFWLNTEEALLSREAFIQKEISSYTFDENLLLKNAKVIQAAIFPRNNSSVEAKIERQNGTKLTLQVTNYHATPLEIVGFGSSARVINDTLERGRLLEVNLENSLPTFTSLATRSSMAYIFFKVPGIDSIFHSEISVWGAPEVGIPSHELFENVVLSSNSVYKVKGNLVTFNEGEHNVSSNIVIPEGYQVHINGQTTLNLTRGATFISKSPIHAVGREDGLIKIRSSDKTSGGLVILNTTTPSVFRNVIFKNLKNLNYKNWTLPSAVTFYNTEVLLENCTFTGTNSVNSLHLIGSQFELNGCNFTNINKSKAIIGEYSEGIVKQTMLYDTQSAMDWVNSKVTITDSKINQTQNDAIVARESSKIIIEQLTIQGVQKVAITSSDLSKVNIKNISLIDCGIGFAAYRKKPEFGSSEIIVDNYTSKQVNSLHQVQVGSILNLKGKEIKGY